MPRSKKPKFVPVLAPKWEHIARVRSRVRRGSHWLKYAKGIKGNDIIQCTGSLSTNFEVLACAFESRGLKLQSVKSLEKEARVVLTENLEFGSILYIIDLIFWGCRTLNPKQVYCIYKMFMLSSCSFNVFCIRSCWIHLFSISRSNSCK